MLGKYHYFMGGILHGMTILGLKVLEKMLLGVVHQVKDIFIIQI
jgi:hypothetical protein